MKISDIISYLNEVVPLSLQEDYDNSGLQCGDVNQTATSALLTIDVTEAIVDEAVMRGANLIISHHPLIYRPLREVSSETPTGRLILKALRNNITIYSAHTNLDVAYGGVSWKMAEKLGLTNITPLLASAGSLLKLVTFVTESYAAVVRDSLFAAGAGSIGNYDQCSFTTEGTGTFRGGQGANPFVGNKGELHKEREVRIEVVLPMYLKEKIVSALLEIHPYEEVAYDLYQLDNKSPLTGMGVIGTLKKEVTRKEFLGKLSLIFNSQMVRHTDIIGGRISRVALCGGSGASLLGAARSHGADAFVTGDIKYHTWFEGSDKLFVADIGHYESEKFTVEIIYDLLIKKFPKFALLFSELNTNPINYFHQWKK